MPCIVWRTLSSWGKITCMSVPWFSACVRHELLARLVASVGVVAALVCVLRVAPVDADAVSPMYWSSPVGVDLGSYPTGAFEGISCLSTSLCVAVDRGGNVVSSTHPEAEAGAWSVAHVEGAETPEIGPGSGADTVSCVSGPLCVALAGRVSVMTSTEPAAGAGAWARAEVGAGDGGIRGVSCGSASMCVAVDETGSVITSTDPTGGSSAWSATDIDGTTPILGIACPSASFCVAVDANGNTLVSSDPTGGSSAWVASHLTTGQLDAVSCVGSELCLVGGSPQSFVSTDPAAANASWIPIEGLDGAGGVSCASSAVCVAVAESNAGLRTSENPTGGITAWTTGPEANGVGLRFLNGVSCPSVSLCVALDGAGDVFVGAGTHTLSVSLLGNAVGSIHSSLPECPFNNCSHEVPGVLEAPPILGIDCFETVPGHPIENCAFGFPTTNEVILTATPGAGAVFGGWSGECSGFASCTVNMSTDRSVSATFAPSSQVSPGPTLALITNLHESHANFADGRSSTPLNAQTASRKPKGTVFSFTLSQPATIHIAITTKTLGWRLGHSCKPQHRRKSRHQARCTRTVAVPTLTRTGHAGNNQTAFTGRINKRALPPGHYTARFSTTDTAGTTPPQSLNFAVSAH